MPDLLASLVAGEPVGADTWRDFWSRLRERRLRRGEATAVVAVLSARMPRPETVSAMLTSFDTPAPSSRLAGSVNIVGTGGGPPTFNISTASALVAAAMGVRVVKTGSRAYTSRHGSFDLLERLGIPLTTSYPETAESLDRRGIAFADNFVYPRELTLLARSVLPFGMRQVGRFFNKTGPFLASVPVSAQLVGVSDHSLVPVLRQVAGQRDGVWLCVNDLGADELISFTDNLIYAGPDEHKVPASHDGDLADLAPVTKEVALIGHFLAILRGEGSPSATETIALNAAALALAGGYAADWATGMRTAHEVIARGHAERLAERLADTS